MISQELEVSLHACFVDARQKRHEFVTVEHLLLCLLDNPSAKAVLMACSDNPNVISLLKKDLEGFIKDNTPTVIENGMEVDTQPTLGFQRVIQRAIMHVSSTGHSKKEVDGENVLLALFGERDSHAVHFLHQQGINRLDVVGYMAHGIRKDGEPEVTPETKPQVKEEIKLSSFQFYVKLKDGAVDQRFLKLSKKFKALIKKEFPNTYSTPGMTLFSFLSSDNIAASSSVAEDKVTLHKN